MTSKSLLKFLIVFSVVPFFSCETEDRYAITEGQHELSEETQIIQQDRDVELTGKGICYNSYIPYGYVLSYRYSSLSCNKILGTNLNAKYIKIPGNYEVVCRTSPIPRGYVLIGRSIKGFSCLPTIDRTPNGNVIIKAIANRITICKNSPIPNGYRIVGESNIRSCQQYINSRYSAYIIQK